MAIRVSFSDSVPVEAIAKIRDSRLRGLCNILRQDDPRVLHLNPTINDCANVKAALRELRNEGISFTTVGDCKRPRTASLVTAEFDENFPLDMPEMKDIGFLGLCKDTRPGNNPRSLVLRPTELEYVDLKTTLTELSEQAAVRFVEEPVCCICLAGASNVRQMISGPGLVAGTEIFICGDCIHRGLEKDDVVDSKPVLGEARQPVPVMRCDFCNHGLDQTEYLLTSDEAYICDGCLRLCSQSLGETTDQ